MVEAEPTQEMSTIFSTFLFLLFLFCSRCLSCVCRAWVMVQRHQTCKSVGIWKKVNRYFVTSVGDNNLCVFKIRFSPYVKMLTTPLPNTDSTCVCEEECVYQAIALFFFG